MQSFEQTAPNTTVEGLQSAIESLGDTGPLSSVPNSSKAPDGSTLDEYLEKARTNPHAETRGAVRPGAQQARSNEPSPLEIEVRNFLSAMNRDERRNWLARQRIAAGKVRKALFTVGKTK